jgi:uncharacterized protein
MYILWLIIIFVILMIMYKLLDKINNSLLFRPTREFYEDASDNHMLENVCGIKIHTGFLDSTNGCKIYYNYVKNDQPKLFIFAHGNAGNISHRIESETIQLLLKYRSVLLFDYRGYGISTGNPSENGIKDDMLAVWKYATNNLGYQPDDIILYGESLGCSVVSWLCYYLINNKAKPPSGIIMQSGFYSLRSIVADLFHSILSHFVLYEFDNSKYVKFIKKHNPQYPIILLHSKKDGLIKYEHSQRLASENNCNLYEIFGDHNNPIFGDDVNDLLKNLNK